MVLRSATTPFFKSDISTVYVVSNLYKYIIPEFNPKYELYTSDAANAYGK